MSTEKPANKGFFEHFLYLWAFLITAGNGGRTRKQWACLLALLGAVPNYVPIPK